MFSPLTTANQELAQPKQLNLLGIKSPTTRFVIKNGKFSGQWALFRLWEPFCSGGKTILVSFFQQPDTQSALQSPQKMHDTLHSTILLLLPNDNTNVTNSEAQKHRYVCSPDGGGT